MKAMSSKKALESKKVRKTAVKSKAKAKAKSGGKVKGKKEEPTDIGPYGFDEDGEEEPHEVDEELQLEESTEVTRKRKEPIAPPPAEIVPVKKACKPNGDDVAETPMASTAAPADEAQSAKAPAAAPAVEAKKAETPPQASSPPVVTAAEGDTQEGTLWFLGSNSNLSTRICCPYRSCSWLISLNIGGSWLQTILNLTVVGFIT